MSNLIDIDKFKEKNRMKIEEKAYDLYGIIKVKEDLYIYPESAFVSNSAEVSHFFSTKLGGMTPEQLLEKEAVDEINSIVPIKGQSVKILLHKAEENDMLTFDIFNTSLNKGMFITTPMEYNELNRTIFTAIVAGAIKKVDVDVTFLVKLNYKEVEDMVKK